MIEFLRAKSPLRAGLSADRATDALLFLVSPASYRTLVVDRGWSHEEWVSRTSETLTAQVFDVPLQRAGPGPSA